MANRYRMPAWFTHDIAEYIKGLGADGFAQLLAASKHTTLIEECKKAGIKLEDVRHYWYKGEHHSIFSKIQGHVASHSDFIAKMMEEYRQAAKVQQRSSEWPQGRTCVLLLSDFHFGANVQAMLKTPSFNAEILMNRIENVVRKVNTLGYDCVHVALLGDFIESFTGMNHVNVWKELQSWGWSAVSGVTGLLMNSLLEQIQNLGKVYMVSGNHDRLTVKMEGDMLAEGAAIMADLLKLHGYNVEYSPFLVNPEIDGVKYILTHGHLGLSNMEHSQLLFEYGSQGMYNVVAQGHWHTKQVKKTMKAMGYNYNEAKVVSLEMSRSRHIVVPPMFTGNTYSATAGYSSQAGFTVICRSGNGIDHFDFCA